MTYKHFKISDTHGTALDISDLLKIELRGEILTFDTKWDETIIAMQKQPDEELLETVLQAARDI